MDAHLGRRSKMDRDVEEKRMKARATTFGNLGQTLWEREEGEEKHWNRPAGNTNFICGSHRGRGAKRG